jgi:uncharacterized membrane protein YphA (DoxX/SURF4 family)
MNLRSLDHDRTDLVFRVLFSSIFLALGLEHLFDDGLIRQMMPALLPFKRAVSVCCGLWLLAGGGMLLTGWHTRRAAAMLGAFLVVVTAVVHLRGVLGLPDGLPEDWGWLWQVYQRSNLVKNLCLLGVCFHLLNHEPGRFSLDHLLERRR